MRRTIAFLLAAILLFGTIPVASAAAGMTNFKKTQTYANGQFTDVKTTDWFASGVQAVYELGIMQGSGKQTFRPTGNLTVAEGLAIACRLHSIYADNGQTFAQGQPWYQVYADYAAANKIMKTGQLDPLKPITREQFAYLMCGAIPTADLNAINTIKEIPDEAEKSTYGGFVYRLYRAGVLTGSDKYGTFNPTANIRRSEVAVIVTRMADKSQRKTFALETRPAVTGIRLVGKTQLLVGESAAWTAQTLPADSASKITWTAGNPAVATVDQNGRVTAKKAGQCNITAAAANGVKKTALVTVVVLTTLYTQDGRVIEVLSGEVEAKVKAGWSKTASQLTIRKTGEAESVGWVFGNGCMYMGGSGKIPNGFVDRSGCKTDLYALYVKRGITGLGDSSFAGAGKLNHVEIPDTVTSVGRYAFAGCALKRIGIPKSVAAPDGYSFDKQGLTAANSSNKGMTVYGEPGSAAQTFAKKYNLSFVPATCVYYPDGRTMMVSADERPVYLRHGWYETPVTTLYALDGRTLTLPLSKVEAHLKVGWHRYPDYAYAAANNLVKSSGYAAAMDYLENCITEKTSDRETYGQLIQKRGLLIQAWIKAEGSPLVIEKYEVSRVDPPRVIIRFRNLADKKVDAFTVTWTCLDKYGKATTDYPKKYNGSINGHATNVNLGPNEADTYFMDLYDSEDTHSIKNLMVTDITYDDGSIWKR